jgi:hypothetical protein
MAQSNLKSILAKFLKNEEIGKYPQIETQILCLSPLQITDDFHRFIDVSSLEDSITEELDSKPARGHKLILQDWKFVLRRIPNTHEYYFDLAVKRYELVAEDLVIKPEHEPIKMEDDEEIRYLFEARKRQEIEKMVRAKEPSTKDENGTKSASKETVTKLDTALPSQKVTESKEAHGTMTSEEFKRTIFAKPSIVKTEAKKSPVYLDSSFFRKAGVITTAPKFNPEDLLYLAISELMSVPAFIPPVKKSVIRYMPPIRVRRSTSSESLWEDYKRESTTKMVQRHSVERESRYKQMNFEFEDVHEYIRAGLINWDQLIFNRNSFEYLQTNSRLLENTE